MESLSRDSCVGARPMCPPSRDCAETEGFESTLEGSHTQVRPQKACLPPIARCAICARSFPTNRTSSQTASPLALPQAVTRPKLADCLTVGTRLAETGMIEGIEHLPAELDPVALTPCDVLQHSHIPGVDTVALQNVHSCGSDSGGTRTASSSEAKLKALMLNIGESTPLLSRYGFRIQISPADAERRRITVVAAVDKRAPDKARFGPLRFPRPTIRRESCRR